jgi:cell wall-associated NlpC family hydrolase
MLLQRKLNNKQNEKRILYLIGGVILLFLSVNSILLHQQNKDNSNSLTPEKIEATSLLYLKGNENETAGYRLDCSGFTRRVYKQCNLTIPFSAKEQFASCKRLTMVELKKGNLVFFNTNKSGISHAGIFLDSNRFIHSPGKMKYVRIDSLTNPYWEKCFVCGGMPNFYNSIILN